MNFSLDWFLTIPGMLITGGVLLLVIALTILLVTSSKAKKGKKKEKEEARMEDIGLLLFVVSFGGFDSGHLFLFKIRKDHSFLL